jgi:peptide/nickel transport system permease protein
MLTLIVRRLAFLVLVVFGVSVITFIISNAVPGDPARLLAGPRATPEQVTEMRVQLGLDRPLPERYVRYLGRVLQGDLGTSIVDNQPVSRALLKRIPATLELMLSALVLSLLIGIPLGVLAAVRKGGWVDHVVRAWSVLGISLPAFWLGLAFILVFYGGLGVLPASGRLAGPPPPHVTGLYTLDALLAADLRTFADAVRHLFLPALTIAFGEIGNTARLVRTSMIETLQEDYVLLARASGIPERQVVFHDALRNALIPFTTLMGLALASMLYGGVVIEAVFAWPGIGRYVVDAIFNLDFAVVMAFTIVVSIAYVLINLVVDIIYTLLDPQVRHVG